MIIQVKNIEPNDHLLWNQFISSMDFPVTIAQNPCLGSIIQNLTGWSYRNLAIVDCGKILATFPYVLIADVMVSMPYFSYGGIIKSRFCTFSDQEILDAAIAYEYLENGISVKNTELRSFRKVLNYHKINKVVSMKKLPDNIQSVHLLLSSNVKRKIARSCTLGVEVIQGGAEILEDFYSVYKQNMKSHGSPPMSLDFLKKLITNYKYGKASVFVAYYKKKVVGASISLGYQDFMENTWFSTLRKYNRYYVSYALHWAMMEFAVKEGMKTYSFGRSERDSGTHRYKKQWGVDELILYFNYLKKPGKSIKDCKFLSSIWKVIPCFLTDVLFPEIGNKIY